MIEDEGQLKGAFHGFKNTDTVFEFVNGHKWMQAEYKYHYHYAYMPRAKVIRDGSTYYLEVKGINDTVKVRKI